MKVKAGREYQVDTGEPWEQTGGVDPDIDENLMRLAGLPGGYAK